MIKDSIILLLIATVIIFSGCGGNDVSQGITENSKSGTFTVTVNMPASSHSEKIIPLGSTFVTVTIEHISGIIVPSDFVPLTESTVVSLSGIPVGINTATIKIWDSEKANIKSIKKYGFFLTSGQNANPGDIEMGMAIDPNANIIPNLLTFYLISGTKNIYIENYDDMPHSIRVDTILPQTLNLNAAVSPVLPNTPPVFDGKFFTFDTHGTYNIYIDGSTTPKGQIIILKPGGGGGGEEPIPSQEPG